MSKVFIEESTLTAIGNSIRTKTGETELIAPLDMPSKIEGIVSGSDPVVEALEVTSNGTYTAPDGVDGYTPVTVNVPQDGAPSAEDLTFTGDCSYLFYGGNLSWLIEKYGTQIVFNKVNALSFGFQQNPIEDLSMLTINFNNGDGLINGCFQNCNKLVKLPKIIGGVKNSLSALFHYCYAIRDEEVITFFNNIAYTSDWQISISNLFSNCYSLRNIDEALEKFHNMCIGIKNPSANPSITGIFQNCYSLDEITKFPVLTVRALTSNTLNNVFYCASRCKNIMFCTNEDGTPIVAEWKSQTFDLTMYVGYVSGNESSLLNYNSGITIDKKVTDDATYQALKNDPDWYTTKVEYSRYNHDSAVNTINSLPDTSAYGTNTIKFKGASGSLTDGGAINTLTEEEIAVAAAKGWTVTLV